MTFSITEINSMELLLNQLNIAGKAFELTLRLIDELPVKLIT